MWEIKVEEPVEEQKDEPEEGKTGKKKKYTRQETVGDATKYAVRRTFTPQHWVGKLLGTKDEKTCIYRQVKWEEVSDTTATTPLLQEARTICRLLRKGSERTPRIFDMFYVKARRYLIMSMTHLSTLVDAIKIREEPWKDFVRIHVIKETFMCIADVHVAECCHFDVQPSSFAISSKNHEVLVFHTFSLSETISELKNRRENRHRPKHTHRIGKYSSRRQHKFDPVGRVDDYEAWFYMSYEILYQKNLPWSQNKSWNMLANKWLFPVDFVAPEPGLGSKEMKQYMAIVLGTNDTNFDVHQKFMILSLKDWAVASRKKAGNAELPWAKRE